MAIQTDRHSYRRWHSRVFIIVYFIHISIDWLFLPHLFSGRLYSWSHSTWALHRAFGSQLRRWSLAYESAFSFCSSRWSPTDPTCAPRSAPRLPTAFLPITPCASNRALSPGPVFCPCKHCSCCSTPYYSVLICMPLLLVRTASSSTRSSCRWWCSARSTTRSSRSSPSSAKWSRARYASWRTTTRRHCSCAPVVPSFLLCSHRTLLKRLKHTLSFHSAYSRRVSLEL